MSKLLENVELSWVFLDPANPQENFEKMVWSVTANVEKEVATKFKKAGFIRSLRPVEDADGNETGQYKITFKQNAVTSAGKEMRAPGLFIKGDDGTVKALTGVMVGNGSIGSISFDTYDWKYKGKEGTSMSLKNVLVTTLIPYEAQEPAGSEFGAVEGSEFDNKKESPFKDSKDLDLDIDNDDFD